MNADIVNADIVDIATRLDDSPRRLEWLFGCSGQKSLPEAWLQRRFASREAVPGAHGSPPVYPDNPVYPGNGEKRGGAAGRGIMRP